ncbi:MAG: hypothetical protein IJK31_08970 [Ruminococcus sp.]|nr:hypothetical protein [Ruminococcus sp.]
MKMILRKMSIFLIVSSMVCGAAACGSKGSSSSEEKAVEIEEAVGAESGDAFLYINEAQGWIQYAGKKDDPAHTMLSYDAGVPHINGSGSYTVSVNADTNGFRIDTAGDAEDDSIKPSGLMFAAVVIKDGKQLYPDAVITIDAIRVDGNEITMKSKNYTSSDDGVELRSNIYNTWVGGIPDDAVSVNGKVAVDDSSYSPCIVDAGDFKEWTKVEVDFTVSGI